MPTILEDLMQSAALPALLDHAGKDIAYTPVGGPTRTIKAIVAVLEELESRIVDDGEEVVQRANLGIANDATTGVTSVAAGDVFTFHGAAWSHDKWHRLDGAHWLEVVRVVELRKSNRERSDDVS